MLTQLVANGLVTGALVALLATGFGLQQVASRFFVFTFGSCFACGAYVTLWASVSVPLAFAALFGAATASALAVVLEALAYAPLRRRGRSPMTLMLASIGLDTIFQNVLSLAFGDGTRALSQWPSAEGHAILGARLSTVRLIEVATSGMLVAAVGLLTGRTSWGRQLRALRDDELTARVVGVDCDRVALGAVAVAGALAGTGGVLSGFDTGLLPGMGFQALLYAFVAYLLGGDAGAGSATLAGVLLGLILHLGVWKLPSRWQDAILFIVLVGLLLFRPRGLFGQSRREEIPAG